MISPLTTEVNILVTSAIAPILIGQNILSHRTPRLILDQQPWRNHRIQTLTHSRLVMWHTQPPLKSPHDYAITSKHNPVYSVQTIFSTDSQRATIPSSHGQTFEEKTTQAKTKNKVNNPESPEPRRTEKRDWPTLALHWHPLHGEKGTFIKPVRIPTNGQSRSQRQQPIAQALEADVDDEINCMAAEGIIETCHDPKGFNSPVFAVRKKNGTIRVVENFKRTLNKVLVDLDPYPTPRIDQLFHKIREGNKYFATLDLRSG